MNTNIGKIRKENKLTQKQFAEILETKQTTVSEWENGRNYPQIETLIKMSEIFGKSIEYIVGLEDNSGINYPKRVLEVSEKEKRIIFNYRKSDDNTQNIVDTALNIKE